jgi:hypothetical protein
MDTMARYESTGKFLQVGLGSLNYGINLDVGLPHLLTYFFFKFGFS